MTSWPFSWGGLAFLSQWPSIPVTCLEMGPEPHGFLAIPAVWFWPWIPQDGEPAADLTGHDCKTGLWSSATLILNLFPVTLITQFIKFEVEEDSEKMAEWEAFTRNCSTWITIALAESDVTVLEVWSLLRPSNFQKEAGMVDYSKFQLLIQ